MNRPRLRLAHAFLSLLLVAAARPGQQASPFTVALEGAERAIAAKELDKARQLVMRALERDAKSTRAWAVRAKLAEAAGDKDELVYALHNELRLAVAQKAAKAEVDPLREHLKSFDPAAAELFGINSKFVATLVPIAEQYEKEKRPHSAIRVHKLILALEPESTASQVAIERISAAPDPSLAGDAKPKDLLADVSAEWIRDFDAKHATWDARAKLERDNYTTYTNAGYEVLVRAAEAMEQMNRFYREFFQYGSEEDKKSVSRIDLNIFKLRDEYLKLGYGPPVEWSGGHFTGGAVETYVEGNGFEGMTSTLFHEAAHQFVSLATNAAGWLNEGLASFFEGCQILPNGTVLMNMPASQRLFPLAERMEKGWMASASDGLDPVEPSKSNPDKAPTFRIVIENEYEWGPPWYAPTWGVVFFLYNYQDPVDGRFVYRKAFRAYVDASGGLQGKTAVEKFQEVVLAAPLPPIKGFDRKGAADVAQPKTIDELDETWKTWMLELRDEQIGKSERVRPYLQWARAALTAKDDSSAKEHFEKGLVATPNEVELLTEFAQFLADKKNTDRATKLGLAAARVLESRDKPDEKAIAAVERLLEKWDPKRATIDSARRDLSAAAKAIVAKYREAKLPMMAMDVSWRLGRDLELPELYPLYEAALRESGRSLALWELAYDEKSLEGWDVGGNQAFKASNAFLEAAYKDFAADQFDYQVLALQRVTAGDFSLEVDVQAARGECNFTGLVFGRKDANNFHAFLYFPGKPKVEGSKAADNAWVDLASFYGSGATKTWRHNPVDPDTAAPGETSAGKWHKLRIDVAGATVDCWFDGELVVTHPFASRDVLRGTFGLVQGRGKARFKDVHFLARDPRDPAGAIERNVRMEKLRAKGSANAGGSYLGSVPPFPSVASWVQGSRASWSEKGAVPQLFVLWRIEQNDLIRIDEWLNSLAKRYAPAGLEIVSVCAPDDADAIGAYLKSHTFPGAVGVDRRVGIGMGETNDLYFIKRFNLPRLVLLDIDQKVAWEGDPGFKIGAKWDESIESFVDTPLRELIAARKLDRLRPWLAAWPEAAQQLRDGDLAAAWARMQEAKEIDGSVVPLAYDVQRKLEALEAALADPVKVGTALEKQGRAPALRALLEWAKTAGHEYDKKVSASLKPLVESSQATHWDRALKMLETYEPKIAKDPTLVDELLGKLDGLKGPFPAELAGSIRSAGHDATELAKVFADAPRMPARWLAREHFRW